MSTNMKLGKLLALFAVVITLSGCGLNSTVVYNLNSSQTVVELGERNFEIIDRVQGEAEVSYILFFGGRKVQALNDAAMANLLEKANLKGSQALVNVTTERYNESYILYNVAKVIVSAHVVEFKD
ncbi:MAG: DUF6567 family protein [Bacteroidota bacterium]